VPGVGKKTAQRLLIELKARLDVPDLVDAPITVPGDAGPTRSALADVRDALTGLGYGPDEIRGILADLPYEGDPALLLKQALQRVALASR